MTDIRKAESTWFRTSMNHAGRTMEKTTNSGCIFRPDRSAAAQSGDIEGGWLLQQTMGTRQCTLNDTDSYLRELRKSDTPLT